MEGEILKDLSTSHSFNQVHLFQAKPHGKIVRKQYGSLSAFKRAVEAFKFVDRSLHPSIYKIDMKHSTIYMSYNPVEKQPESMDECIANLLKKLHSSTLKYSGVWDPGTGQRYANWKEFLQLNGEKAVQTLGELADYSVYFGKWLNAVEESAYSPVSYIHCSISPEHIGQRKGDYILLDFEHAILGDPYWDVACYALEFADTRARFYDSYGVENREKAEAFVHLAALIRAAFLLEHQLTEIDAYKKCTCLLNEN